jgi:Protein of unknown function (DUF2442)
MNIGKITALSITGIQSVDVQWDDGQHAHVNLSAIIAAHPALIALVDPATFALVQIATDGWSIEWPGDLDFGTVQLRRWADEQAGKTMPAAAFRHWMDEHNMTLDSAAKALGLSRRMISYYRSGEQPVPKTVMLATLGYERARAA